MLIVPRQKLCPDTQVELDKGDACKEERTSERTSADTDA